MVKDLAEIEKQTAVENAFLSDFLIKRIEKSLLEQSSSQDTTKLQLELGVRKLRYGLEREAIEQFLKLRKIAELKGDTAAQIDVDFQLAVAYLRLAETENCCSKPGLQSCIFPLKGLAFHGSQVGAE